jgi:putative hydrolase of the HAD superfamily
MPEIQAVLFDFGQVLSLPPDPVVWERMKSLSRLREEQLHARYWEHRDAYDSGHLTGDVYWRRIAGEELDAETLAGLKLADVDLWTRMNPPMMKWVAALHAAGFRTGILSNMPDAMAEGICERFDWIANFDHAVWSHALKLRKPQPEIYAVAVAGLGVAAEHILFLDDKAENIAAAEAAGMHGIVYTDHAAFEQEMTARGFGDLLKV